MNAHQYKANGGGRAAESVSAGMARCAALLLLSLLWVGLWNVRAAELLPLEFHQDYTPYNLQSTNGVPISTNAADPGSDGEMPTVNQSAGSHNLPTTNQFQGFISFGAVPGLTSNVWRGLTNYTDLQAGTAPFSGTVAAEMGLPVGRDGQKLGSPVTLVLRRAQIGAPYMGQQISYLFGSPIAAPNTDEHGQLLTNVINTAYWLPEPYFTTNDTDLSQGYYWSPNASQVFAIQSGPITITWIKAASYTATTVPAYTNVLGALHGTPSFLTNGGSIYELYTASYLVSSSPAKRPEKMYWTEPPFDKTGHLVSVPAASVSAVHVVYNRAFPEYATNLFNDPYVTPQTNPTNTLQEPRTLWYDPNTKTIHAYNIEGRVFVELLGELNPDGSRRFLGDEIVDVYKEPVPNDVTVDLGERVPAYQDGRDDSNLYPSPVAGTAQKFYYQQTSSDGSLTTLYATYRTANLNDFQVHWLITGVAGLQWPYLFDRYHEVWPADPAKYVDYLRPLVATEAEARQTAVQLPGTEAPKIAYQDPFPAPLGASLGSDGLFYTFLDLAHPAHRALLQFTVGSQVAFERVFSWLDVGVKSNALFAGSVATNLTAWNPTNLTLNFASPDNTPHVLTATVNVGDRIEPPSDVLGTASNYWAGYILQADGNSFDPTAYLDPFAVGFDAANQGAIIPVNAIPGHDTLDVWWFRKDNLNANLGFKPSYWPSVIGHYRLQWPANADEIVLASNDGSGPLDSLQAKGTIYRQNDPALPGYNPNEEHALMLGGQAYALRDDLNITNGPNYSSAPFVLVRYTAADGRAAIHAFHVRREDPAKGILFDYVVNAGTILQAPMPLPLLPAPTVGSGQYATNYDTEPPGTSGDLPVGWNSSFEGSQYAHYAAFTYQDRKHEFWVYRGLNAGLPPLAAGHYDPASNTFDPQPAATAVRGQPFEDYIHVSRVTGSLTVNATNLPDGLSVETANGVAIAGTPTVAGSNVVTLTIHDAADDSMVATTFELNVVTNQGASIVAQGPLTITSTNQYARTDVTFSNRPPFLAQAPGPSNSFTMRFYYKTMPSFDWPGMANPPPPGSIVPYLRPLDTAGTNFVGDPASSNTASLDIVYRPVWPSLVNGQPLPTLYTGQTLTVPKNGLAAVRGQSSVNVLYQQSIGLDITDAPASVVLYDPTVQKVANLSSNGLSGLPASVVSRPYLGKDYFPNLPPNLVNRVFYDPNTDSLVLQGRFVSETVGDSYLLLNVLGGADLAAVKGLCPVSDSHNKPNWDALVDALATKVYTFHEDPAAPGSYVDDNSATVTVGVTNLVAITNSDTQVDSYAMSATGPGTGYVSYIVGNGHNPAHAGEPVTVYILRVSPELYPGELKVLPDPNPLDQQITFQHSDDLAGRSGDYEYDWRIAPPVDGQPPVTDPTNWPSLTSGVDITHFTLGAGAASIQTLGDNYVAVRYRSIDPLANPASTNWSDWTQPALAEGWIKRALAGINPFNQRTSDLFNNPVNTTASIVAQAGPPYQGDVALNQDDLNNYGLIQIYETLLHRGEALSINAGINYGPANDALLLAAGYLNDLYMTLGNDAWADAANPTIGFGTADKTYGDLATAQFAFEGQEPSLLDEELALLRGRDDFLSPGTRLPPVYNRLYWNFTGGINSGQVIYELNYNIQDENNDGVVDAKDAAILYPQGHGDAYGQYLTALMNYYSLLLNPNFDWVPRIETVNVLGAAVSVDYEDERKFAAAAAALARTGRQVFDLTWREDYHAAPGSGWDYFADSRVNAQEPYDDAGQTKYVTRHWGMDNWASRVGQGAYLNWVVGNAILPPVDPNPAHEGIQKIDRTTVPELTELPATETALQQDMDDAEAGFTPLGLPRDSIPFDINPLQVTGANPQTHFEQIYGRAVDALNNAVVAFNDAQNVTQTMRSEQDSLTQFQVAYTNQETAYNDQLIELYGTPYPDDIGPGKTYPQGYTGPDLIHYTYVENPDTNDFNGVIPDPTKSQTFYVDVQNVPTNWLAQMLTSIGLVPSTDPSYTNNSDTNKIYSIPFNIGPNGFFDKPANWTSQRESPGEIQQAISALIAAQNHLRKVVASETYDKQALDKAMMAAQSQLEYETNVVGIQNQNADMQTAIDTIQAAYDVENKANAYALSIIENQKKAAADSTPTFIIAGTSDGGNALAVALFPEEEAFNTAAAVAGGIDLGAFIAATAANTGLKDAITQNQKKLNNMQLDQDTKNAVLALGNQELDLQNDLFTINEALRGLDDARRAYQALVAKGNRIQQERLTFRQHAAAIIQGYRTRDAAFLIFQNERLERYKSLFDLAAEYAYLAAQAYDYDTGLLNTQQGQDFLNRIISARALGVVENGQPQYAGSNTGDPGLSSALAEMKADWDVLKGRLGFNNPDGYGTLVSLRTENYRILPGSAGDSAWKDVLERGRMDNLLDDPDVKRYCMQIDDGSGQPVPGIVLTFGTTIQDGLNLFGQPLAPGDHSFSPSSFATKIFAVGVDFDGYIGMDNPTSGSTSGGTTPPDPTLDPDALAATPYVYLIPVGADSMRSPPLGDVSTIRTWNVDDLTIPLPFNISGSDFSTTPFYTALDSLSEPLLSVRKYQAFRPVSDSSIFTSGIYAGIYLAPSQFTNQRLIGRSVWNSRWKLVIPGKTLLNDPNEGLDRFIRTVKDIKLYFVTYSYAGN